MEEYDKNETHNNKWNLYSAFCHSKRFTVQTDHRYHRGSINLGIEAQTNAVNQSSLNSGRGDMWKL